MSDIQKAVNGVEKDATKAKKSFSELWLELVTFIEQKNVFTIALGFASAVVGVVYVFTRPDPKFEIAGMFFLQGLGLALTGHLTSK